MAGTFAFKLEHEDGTPADPARASHGHTDVVRGRHHSARRRQNAHVIETRFEDDEPVLVVRPA
jgi:hypothetical protein